MFQHRIASVSAVLRGGIPKPPVSWIGRSHLSRENSHAWPLAVAPHCVVSFCIYNHRPIQSSLDACPFTHALHQSETAPLAKAPVGDLPAHRTLCMPALLDGTGRCVPCAKQWTAYCAPFTVARVCTIRGVSVLPISDTLKTPT